MTTTADTPLVDSSLTIQAISSEPPWPAPGTTAAPCSSCRPQVPGQSRAQGAIARVQSRLASGICAGGDRRGPELTTPRGYEAIHRKLVIRPACNHRLNPPSLRDCDTLGATLPER